MAGLSQSRVMERGGLRQDPMLYHSPRCLQRGSLLPVQIEAIYVLRAVINIGDYSRPTSCQLVDIYIGTTGNP
jgi:hypothetical protein